MKLFLDYLNKIKLQILLMLFPTILTGMIFLLYQLPLEPILYIAVLWILTGLGTCAFGFHNYQKNIHNLQIISAAPDINLSRMGCSFQRSRCSSAGDHAQPEPNANRC